jgi:hypothetical protein
VAAQVAREVLDEDRLAGEVVDDRRAAELVSVRTRARYRSRKLSATETQAAAAT